MRTIKKAMTLCNMNKIEFKNRLHKGIKPIIEKNMQT